jgi:hypothetical protein
MRMSRLVHTDNWMRPCGRGPSAWTLTVAVRMRPVLMDGKSHPRGWVLPSARMRLVLMDGYSRPRGQALASTQMRPISLHGNF